MHNSERLAIFKLIASLIIWEPIIQCLGDEYQLRPRYGQISPMIRFALPLTQLITPAMSCSSEHMSPRIALG